MADWRLPSTGGERSGKKRSGEGGEAEDEAYRLPRLYGQRWSPWWRSLSALQTGLPVHIRLRGHVGRHRSRGSAPRLGAAIGGGVLGCQSPDRVSTTATDGACLQKDDLVSRGPNHRWTRWRCRTTRTLRRDALPRSLFFEQCSLSGALYTTGKPREVETADEDGRQWQGHCQKVTVDIPLAGGISALSLRLLERFRAGQAAERLDGVK